MEKTLLVVSLHPAEEHSGAAGPGELHAGAGGYALQEAAACGQEPEHCPAGSCSSWVTGWNRLFLEQPMERTYAGAVLEEVQPLGRIYAGEVCQGLYPLGETSH